jgi:hypothetical protein
VQKKAVERLRAFEHPALDIFEYILKHGKQPAYRALAVRVAESVLDRTGHKQPKKLEIESAQTLDVSILSTPLIRQMAAELRAHEARNRLPLTPGATPHERPED